MATSLRLSHHTQFLRTMAHHDRRDEATSLQGEAMMNRLSELGFSIAQGHRRMRTATSILMTQL